MMESFGLYEDLSLFSGDLLVGMNPLADELPISGQDGCFQEPQMFPAQVDLFADELIKPSKPDPPVDDDWMEKKLDLINLLSSPNVHISMQENFTSDVIASSPPSHVDIDSSFDVITSSVDVIAPPQIVEVTYQEMQPAHVAIENILENVSEYLSTDFSDISPTHSANVSFDDLGVDAFGTVDGLAFLFSDQEMKALNDPILSPVSPQDVESILSAGPSSPCSTASINDGVVPQIKTTIDSFFLSEEEHQSQPSIEVSCEFSHRSALSPGPIRPVRVSRKKKYSPYKDNDDTDDEENNKKKPSPKAVSRSLKPPDRKERKKQQNKDAALRYRMKKKQEQSTVFEDCDVLEEKNEELKDKVDSMTREIQYLKDLLLEVYKAKGIQPKGLLVK